MNNFPYIVNRIENSIPTFNFQARESYLIHRKLREEFDGTFTSVLGLNFTVAAYHFVGGEITLKCTSSMLSVYWQSREVIITNCNILFCC